MNCSATLQLTQSLSLSLLSFTHKAALACKYHFCKMLAKTAYPLNFALMLQL